MKNIILLGAPGAGKGTQAALIATRHNVPHISTGDILRRNIKESTPLGVLAKAFIDSGELVPDSVVIGLVDARLKERDCQNGYVLDGFPRTIAQAEELDKVASIDIAVNIDVPYELIVQRLSGRRVCVCGETYHVDTLEGRTECAKCGKQLFVRDDDKPETVLKRLNVYEAQTKPLVEYYKAQGKLANIYAVGSIEEIYAMVERILK